MTNTNTNINIVVVEDNDLLREEMVSFLTRPGWQAHGVDCGEELNRWLTQHTPHIAVLDVNLPYEDGYSIASRLRARYPNIGIVMVTARVRHGERTVGYESGADVYLTKPTSTRELTAVIENLSRRLPDMSLVLEKCAYLDSRRKSLLTPDEIEVELTQREYQLFELLSYAPNQYLSYGELVDGLGDIDDRPFTVEALMVLVSRLRKKLRDEINDDRLIGSIRGNGYSVTMQLRPM